MAQKPTISKTEKVQTAVEWLIEQVNHQSWNNIRIDIPKDVIEQAKQMEKEQIIKAHNDGDVWSGEIYYTKTYGK